MRKDEYERNEEQSLARRCKHIGAERAASGLQHHVTSHDEGVEWISSQLPAQRSNTDGYHDGVIAKEAYCRLGEVEHNARHYDKKDRACHYREPKALVHTLIELRSVAITTERLETLTKPHNDAHNEHRDTTDYGHCRNCCISIIGCREVQEHNSYACQPLARQ